MSKTASRGTVGSGEGICGGLIWWPADLSDSSAGCTGPDMVATIPKVMGSPPRCVCRRLLVSKYCSYQRFVMSESQPSRRLVRVSIGPSLKVGFAADHLVALTQRWRHRHICLTNLDGEQRDVVIGSSPAVQSYSAQQFLDDLI